MAGGRPRGFDRGEALERALLQFWEHGYDGTSIAGLTEALGINPPSLYAAFGDKRRLFDEALDRYVATHGDYGARALAQPTARDAVATLLTLAADAYTGPGRPPGCLVISGVSGRVPSSEAVASRLRDLREATKHAFADRIRADIAAGELPPDTDADTVAAFYAATVQGMETQARDGATRAELQAIAVQAMRAWPT
jgi:AcrR family transcriptional regulator